MAADLRVRPPRRGVDPVQYDIQVPRGFRYDKAEIRIGLQRQWNTTIESPLGAWQHLWRPQQDLWVANAVPPLPDLIAWELDQLRPWTDPVVAHDGTVSFGGLTPALPTGRTHDGEDLWWEYTREGQLHAAFFGQTGAGKTGGAQSLVAAALLSGFEKAFVLDPKQGPDWAWLKNHPKVEFSYSLLHMMRALRSADTLREKRSKLAMELVGNLEDEPLFPPVLVYIDEASVLFTRQKAGDATKHDDMLRGLCSVYVKNLASMGRSANVHLLVVSQRPRADYFDSDTKFNLGYRIGLGDLDGYAAKMIFDTAEAASDRNLDDLVAEVVHAGRGYAGVIGRPLAEVQMFYRPKRQLIQLLDLPAIVANATAASAGETTDADDRGPEPTTTVWRVPQADGTVVIRGELEARAGSVRDDRTDHDVPSAQQPLSDWED